MGSHSSFFLSHSRVGVVGWWGWNMKCCCAFLQSRWVFALHTFLFLSSFLKTSTSNSLELDTWMKDTLRLQCGLNILDLFIVCVVRRWQTRCSESRVKWTEKILGLGSSLFFRSCSAGVQRILSSAAWPEERSMTYWHVTPFIHQWHESVVPFPARSNKSLWMNSRHWASRWRRTCGWRRWASSPRCRRGWKRSWWHPGCTTYHPDPGSSEGLQRERQEQCMKHPTFLHFWREQAVKRVAASHTLHPDTTSPPAQTMVLFTVPPHQSLCVHTLCSTTGSKACCSLSGIGPWAKHREDTHMH